MMRVDCIFMKLVGEIVNFYLHQNKRRRPAKGWLPCLSVGEREQRTLYLLAFDRTNYQTHNFAKPADGWND